MIKLTKKHTEIIETMKSLEKKHNCKLYFMYSEYSGKVHATRIDEIKDNGSTITRFDILCTHNVAMTMQKKGIITPEKIATMKDGSDFKLCRVAI